MFPFAHPYPFDIWNEFEAGQRDLIIMDKNGNLAYHNNITSGIPDSLDNFIRSLSLLNTENGIYSLNLSSKIIILTHLILQRVLNIVFQGIH